MPMENNLFAHTGNPTIDSFTCDISRISGTDVYCNITDLKNTNIREYTYCSGRGTCDFTSGTCYCFDGYTGLACAESSHYTSAANSLPGAYFEMLGNDYTGNVLELRTAKAGGSHMVAHEHSVFSVGCQRLSFINAHTHTPRCQRF